MLGLHPYSDTTSSMAEPGGGSGSTSRPRQEGVDAGTPDTPARHTPILLDVCLDMFTLGPPDEGGVLVNCTLSMSGHSETALKRLHDTHLVDIDRDSQAIALASQRLAPFADRFTAVQTTYNHIDKVVVQHSPSGKADAILMDLGISSFQLDEVERGFSHSANAPLDMRMDPTSGISAAQLLTSVSEKEIARTLRVYGEERFASRIARSIIGHRDTEPLNRTGQLTDIVRATIPTPTRWSGGNPSKRTFQVSRIVVNDELRILEDTIPATLRSLNTDGVLVVELYQSLEDRIVKEVFRAGSSIDLPPGFPVIPKHMASNLELLTREARMANGAETTHNPQSVSVRLRGVRLTREWKEPS